MKKTKKIYSYDVFCIVNDDHTTLNVSGVNWIEAKKEFKKIHGDLKITHHQRLSY